VSFHKAGVDYVAQRLADKQGVAFRLTVDEFGKWLRYRMLASLGQQSVDLVRG
jgi:hypothetical protein